MQTEKEVPSHIYNLLVLVSGILVCCGIAYNFLYGYQLGTNTIESILSALIFSTGDILVFAFAFLLIPAVWGIRLGALMVPLFICVSVLTMAYRQSAQQYHKGDAQIVALTAQATQAATEAASNEKYKHQRYTQDRALAAVKLLDSVSKERGSSAQGAFFARASSSLGYSQADIIYWLNLFLSAGFVLASAVCGSVLKGLNTPRSIRKRAEEEARIKYARAFAKGVQSKNIVVDDEDIENAILKAQPKRKSIKAVPLPDSTISEELQKKLTPVMKSQKGRGNRKTAPSYGEIAAMVKNGDLVPTKQNLIDLGMGTKKALTYKKQLETDGVQFEGVTQ